MRESQARILTCPECGAAEGKPCKSLSGKTAGRSRNTAHAARREAVANYIADAYCANESLAGYPCGRPQCTVCGGATPEEFAEQMQTIYSGGRSGDHKS